jgi:hypothetical protein
MLKDELKKKPLIIFLKKPKNKNEIKTNKRKIKTKKSAKKKKPRCIGMLTRPIFFKKI